MDKATNAGAAYQYVDAAHLINAFLNEFFTLLRHTHIGLNSQGFLPCLFNLESNSFCQVLLQVAYDNMGTFSG